MGEPYRKSSLLSPAMPKWFSPHLMPEAGQAFSFSPVVDSCAMAIQHITESPSPERMNNVLHLGNVTKL